MSAVKLQSANNGLGTEVEEGMVGGRSAPLFPSCNFDGKRRRDAKKKVATNCSTGGATASQRRSNVYRRYVKKKGGKREIYETVTPLIIFRPSVHEDRDNPS